MAFPSQHFLLAFGGPLFGGEQWSMSLRSTVGGGIEDNVPVHQGVLETLRPILQAWITDNGSSIGSQARLGWAKYNRIMPTGLYKHGSTARVDYLPPVGPTQVTQHAPQVSLVATLETGQSRGLAHRGRIFLPAPRASVGADGRISAGDANSYATSIAGLISALNAIETYGLTVVMSNVREGSTRPVTGVSVGRTLDTMRSRRTSLIEERSAPVAVAPGGS